MMKVKKGGVWVNIGGGSLNDGDFTEGLSDVGIAVEGKLKFILPVGKTSVTNLFAGWTFGELPTLEGTGSITNMGRMFANTTLTNMDFSKLVMTSVTNIWGMFDGVVAPEGIDFSKLDWGRAGYNNLLYSTIDTPKVKMPKMAGGMSLNPEILSGLTNSKGGVPVLEVPTADYNGYASYKSMLGLTDEDLIITKY